MVSRMRRVVDFVGLPFVVMTVGLMTYLPLEIARQLARGIVLILRVLMPRITGVGRRNLELVFPEKTRAERERILFSSMNILADNLLTFARVQTLTREKALEMYPNWGEWAALLQKTRLRMQEKGTATGIIIATIHFGCTEQVVVAHSLLDRPFSVLARGFAMPLIDKYWTARRAKFGNRVFWRAGGYKEIERRIREGDDVGVLFDQNIKANHATFVSLFGIKAATTKSIGLAALRTGCPILFATSYETAPGRYHIFCREVMNPIDEPGSIEEKVDSIVRELHGLIEEVVRLRPDHWFWIHRRFKTRPPGEPEDLYDSNPGNPRS